MTILAEKTEQVPTVMNFDTPIKILDFRAQALESEIESEKASMLNRMTALEEKNATLQSIYAAMDLLVESTKVPVNITCNVDGCESCPKH